jgi:hypothetical protein
MTTKQTAPKAPKAPKAPRKGPAPKGHNKPPVSADLPQDVQDDLQAFLACLSGATKAQQDADDMKGTAQNRILALLMNDKVWNFPLRLSLSKGATETLKVSGRANLADMKGGPVAYGDAVRALFGVPATNKALKAKFKTQFLAAYAIADVARKERVSVTIDGKAVTFKAPVRNASPLAKSLQAASNFTKAKELVEGKPAKAKGAKTGTDTKNTVDVAGAFALAARAVNGGYVPVGAALDNLRLMIAKLKGHLD